MTMEEIGGAIYIGFLMALYYLTIFVVGGFGIWLVFKLIDAIVKTDFAGAWARLIKRNRPKKEGKEPSEEEPTPWDGEGLEGRPAPAE